MALPLGELLQRRLGVQESEFAAALADFADRAGPLAVVEISPTDYLGEPQQRSLRKLGATLAPLTSGELGPIAALAAAQAELVGKSLSVATVAKRLGVDTSRVRQRIYGRSLYAFKRGGGWLVPAFQLNGRQLVGGLDQVVANLPPGLHPVAVSRWLTTPNPDLALGGAAVSPVTWLASGGPAEPVAALAGGIDQL